MARMLYRLGGWSHAHRRLVVAAWLAILLAVGAASATLKAPTSEVFSLPGTDSQRALDLLDERFPGAGGATARIVFAAPTGRTLDDPRYSKLVEPTVALARRVPQSLGSGEAFAGTLTFSRDRRIAFADLHFLVPVGELKNPTKEALLRVAEPARATGLQVEFSGGVTAEPVEVPPSAEIIGLGVALLVLLVTFGTLLTALLPIVTALVGVGIGLLGISAATGLVELNSTAPILASMLGLAVGIDYALFIVSRHRQQLNDGMDVRDSIALATGTAGGAVVFAGVTVVIALVGMLVIGIPFLSAMGLAAAGTVVVAVLVALTLLPALLSFAGARAARGRRIAPDRAMGARWARLVTRHPVTALVAVIGVLGVIAIPLSDMRLALPSDASRPTKSTERESYALLTKGFGPGFTGPLLVVGDAAGARDPKRALDAAAEALGTFPGIAAISKPEFNRARDLAVVTVTPGSGPNDKGTKDLVSLVRSRAAAAESRYGIEGYVTGTTAANIDISDKIGAGLPGFLALIVSLALVLLLIVFRSIAVPLKAVAGFLLTIAAAFGLSTWVLQQGHGRELIGLDVSSPLVSFLPVLAVAILFGLAMDYQLFLVSRMREHHVHGDEPVSAVIGGFAASARVVTAAALIMMAVFSAFLQAEDLTVKSIALALTVGVLFDAFLIRMTMVPAALALMRDRAWWLPRWLDRRLPKVDIEGEGLSHGNAVVHGHK